VKSLVLVIEDNEQNLYLTRYLLQAHGYLSLEARDGPAGIALAKASFPQIILLDIQLPEMNGYEVAMELRKDERLHRVPIIAVTSHAMVGDRERALAAGCDGYIEKPINPETFIGEVEEFLNNFQPSSLPCPTY
jgi:two-component system, cell cycle response regulator DivK